MTKIIFVGGRGNRSGVPRYISELIGFIDSSERNKCDLVLVASKDEGGWSEIEKRVKALLYDGFDRNGTILGIFGSVIRIICKIVSERPDVIVANTSLGIFAARAAHAALCLQHRCPKLICVYHGVPFDPGVRGMFRMFMRVFESISLVLAFRHVVVAISRHNFFELAGLPGMKRHRLHLVPNCPPVLERPVERSFDTESFAAGYILWVGRDGWQKCPELCVQIADLSPDLNFVMVGGGILESFSSKGLHVPPNVILCGELPVGQTLYRRASCLLMTSRYEGFPMVALEAASLGCPVVMPPVSGQHDLSLANGNVFSYDPVPNSEFKPNADWNRVANSALSEIRSAIREPRRDVAAGRRVAQRLRVRFWRRMQVIIFGRIN